MDTAVSALDLSPIVRLYRERTPRSAALAEQAKDLLPSGITHDSRRLVPYGIYVTHAQGAHKWDVDGNRYVDYFGGHGALLLGHNDADVVAATQDAISKGTHFGANHEAEVRWARILLDMTPAAERARFFSSGTEATLMAMRLARAFSGRNRIVRFQHHFHGWHDHVTNGQGGDPAPGVLPEIVKGTVVLEPSIEQVRNCLLDNDDIAAVIVEPTGATFGQVPLKPDFLHELRRVTAENGVLLIFDEVITGFRVSPGGAQGLHGIAPDLSCFAKILGGGLPGGAVAGRSDILDRLDFDQAESRKFERVQHFGTFNANPLSAAAGIKTLEIVKAGDACERANRAAGKLRGSLNAILLDHGVPWAYYGEHSNLHLFMNPKRRAVNARTFNPHDIDASELRTQDPSIAQKLRMAVLNHGVDFNGRNGGFLSRVHTDEDLEKTAIAFESALRMLRDEEELR